MDIITQGLLGATVAQASAKPKDVRWALLVGFFAPLLADADIFMRSAEDPLLVLENHRHFTHSLLFIPAGALIASLLLWPFLRKRIGFKKIYFFGFLGYATAGFLDACTSYGTHLLWPFNDERIAWSIISIVDPLFSLALVAAIVVGVVNYQRYGVKAGKAGVVFAVAYLLLGTIQHGRVESLAHVEAQQRGHTIERLIVKPSFGNLLLWRSVYESDGMYYVDGIRVGLPHTGKVFKGNRVQVFDMKRDLPQVTDQMVVYDDIQRFKFFSDGFLAWHPERANVLGDVRYSILPTGIRPLWGIELNLEAPDEHVTFENYRTMSDAEREAFITMLFD